MNNTTEIQFRPEKTAIDTGNAFTAKLLAKNVLPGDKVLDYGFGTGRNMRYIKQNTEEKNIQVVGCEIKSQLEYNEKKHQIVIDMGMEIIEDTIVPRNTFDIVLNSHVLNVIPTDEEKQSVVKNIYESLIQGGHALIEVRTKRDVESAKYKEPYADGWHIIRLGTYQEVITKEKLIKLVTKVGFKIEEHISNSSRHYIIVQK